AGAKLTAYLSPETATIYCDDLSSEFILHVSLYKEPVGKVEVLRPFWGAVPSASLPDLRTLY
ncbi:MAG: type IV toxin-antitoxin system AbiEi family antitoxin, partial [Verrucomicrobiota bacterium]